MPVEKAENQDETIPFIALKNNRVKSQNFYKLSNFMFFQMAFSNFQNFQK